MGGLKTPYLSPTGDGLESEEQDEEAPRPKLSVPEELESREALVRACLTPPTATPPQPQRFLSDTLCGFLPPSLVIPQPPLGAMVSQRVILQPQACTPRP